MPKFMVEVTRSFKMQRWVKFEVEAEDLETAIENVDTGQISPPSHDDPRWEESIDLQDETVTAG